MRKIWGLLGLGVVLAAGVQGVLYWRGRGEAPPAAPAPAPKLATAPPPVVMLQAPSFEVLRIDPDSSFVLTGHGGPGSTVNATLDGAPLGNAVVDPQGEWILSGHSAVSRGLHQIEANAAVSGRTALGTDRAVVFVPQAKGARALIVTVSADKPSRLMQAPDWPSPKGVMIESVDAAAGAVLSVAGRAEPGTPLRVTLDGQAVGLATADGVGRWSVSPQALQPRAGEHRLVLEVLDATGQPARTLEKPLGLVTIDPARLKTERVAIDETPAAWRLFWRGGGQTLVYRPALP